jgi:hypothetical protein
MKYAVVLALCATWAPAAFADPPGSGLHVIIDYVARRMSVVRDATRSMVEMAPPGNMADMTGGSATASFVRRGEATVAGRVCTEWQTRDCAGRPALVCITGDGVLLRAGTSEQVQVSAISVEFAPQHSALFRVPSDYVRLAPGTA